jgi:hypothetical protein
MKKTSKADPAFPHENVKKQNVKKEFLYKMAMT